MLERPISPAGWTPVRFDQLATQINERVDNPSEAGVERYVGLEHLDPDSLRIRRWGEPTDVEATKLRFQPGDIIFGRRRVYQRKVAVADFEGICSAHAMVLRAKPNAALPGFLPFFMQSDMFMERALSISVGSLSPTINWTTLVSEQFLLPPRQEQARFIEACSAAARFRDALIDLDFSVQQLSDALSRELFSEVLHQVNGNSITLGEIFENVADRGHSGLPILSVTIDGSVVRRDELDRHVSDESGEEKYLRVQPGDIAYNTMRLWQGAVGIVKEEGLISPAYTVIRLRDSARDRDFFWEMLRSSSMKNEYRKYVTGVASDRWRLYFKDLAKISVTLPTSAKHVSQWSGLKELREKQLAVQARFQEADKARRMIFRDFFG